MCMSMQVTESVHSEIVDAVRSIQFHSESFLSHGAFEALVSFSETIRRIDFDGNEYVVIPSGLRGKEAGRQGVGCEGMMSMSKNVHQDKSTKV